MKRIPIYARGGRIRAHALVDDAEIGWLSQWRWSLDGDGYATSHERIDGRWRTIRMNRKVLGLTFGDGLIGDHLNRNRLDNRRENLRAVDTVLSNQNRGPRRRTLTGFRGVHLVPTGRFIARVSLGTPGKRHNLGTYASAEEAARVAAAFRIAHMPGAVEDAA